MNLRMDDFFFMKIFFFHVFCFEYSIRIFRLICRDRELYR